MSLRQWTFTRWGPDTPMVKYAREAARQGFAVVFLRPGGKEPVCPLNARERKKAGPDHPCGVSHASADERWVVRVGKRLEEEYGRINIGIAAHPSGVVVIDADGPEETETVNALLAQLGDDAAVLVGQPTVQTPGKQRDGQWVHQAGTHWYFNRPVELTLPEYPGEMVLPGGAVMRWGNSYTVVPPSERAEGRYLSLAEYIPDIPTGLVAMIRAHVAERHNRAAALGERFANDGIVRWSIDHPWHTLLEPDGWDYTGKHDRQCGCPIWRRPGDPSTDRSAIAHEDDCQRLPNLEGHGALHVFSDNPPGLLAERVAAGQRTFTKLQYVSLVHYDGDETVAKVALGIDPDYSQMWDREVAGSPLGCETEPRDLAPSDQEVREAPEIREVGAEPRGEGIWRATARRHLTLLRFDVTESMLDDRVRSSQAVGGKAEDLEIYRDVKAQLATQAHVKREPQDFVDEWLQAEVDTDPTHMVRTDGKFLSTKGRVNMILGRRGCGKTWQALHLALECIDRNDTVGYVDLEDSVGNMRGRFRTMGRDIDQAVIDGQFRRLGHRDVPPDLRSPVVLHDLVEILTPYDIVMFDVVTRLIMRMGGDLNSCNTEMAMLYEHLFDPLAFGMGKLVLFLAHPNSAGQRRDTNPRFIEPAGGAITMNSLSGMGMALETVRPFTKDNPAGEVLLWCRKDRSGYGEGDLLGTFKGSLDIGVDISNLAMATVIEAPDGQSETERHEEAMHRVMDRVLEIFGKRAEGVGALNRTDIKHNLSKGQASLFEEALARLIVNGRVIEVGQKVDLPPKEGA